MAAKSRNMGTLPLEVLHIIFSFVHGEYGDKSIQRARLVCRRFNEAATPYLLTNVFVCATSRSLSRLEDICNHALLRPSITHVTISLAQYDAATAADPALFFEQCEDRFYGHLERLMIRGIYRRCSERRELDQKLEYVIPDEVGEQLWEIADKQAFLGIPVEGFTEQVATPFQRLAMRLHDMYKQRYEDQEEVRHENRHVNRICSALFKLPNLRHLQLQGLPFSVKYEFEELQDLGFHYSALKHFSCTLLPSSWCDLSEMASSTPSIEMLGDLCARLGRGGTRPHSVDMYLKPPPRLRDIALSSDQQLGLRLLVSKATALELTVDNWSRKGHGDDFEYYSRGEMLALCSFTQPFFSAPDLRDLYVFFNWWPGTHETPTTSLQDLLPMDRAWSQLNTLTLKHQAVTIEELRTLVSLHKHTIKEFDWDNGWLLSGSWEEAIEVIRGFQEIEKVHLHWPKGERYGNGLDGMPDVPYPSIYSYILKEIGVNPLGPDENSDESSMHSD